MVKKDELLFARKIVKKGLVNGDVVLECIQLLQSKYEDKSLCDILILKGHISRVQAKEILKEIKDWKEKKEANLETIKKIGVYELVEKIEIGRAHV